MRRRFKLPQVRVCHTTHDNELVVQKHEHLEYIFNKNYIITFYVNMRTLPKWFSDSILHVKRILQQERSSKF